MKKQKRMRLELTKYELINLRRFLVRGAECCHGDCRGYQIPAWCFCNPLLEKINKAIGKLKSRDEGESWKEGEPPC